MRLRRYWRVWKLTKHWFHVAVDLGLSGEQRKQFVRNHVYSDLSV